MCVVLNFHVYRWFGQRKGTEGRLYKNVYDLDVHVMQKCNLEPQMRMLHSLQWVTKTVSKLDLSSLFLQAFTGIVGSQPLKNYKVFGRSLCFML